MDPARELSELLATPDAGAQPHAADVLAAVRAGAAVSSGGEVPARVLSRTYAIRARHLAARAAAGEPLDAHLKEVVLPDVRRLAAALDGLGDEPVRLWLVERDRPPAFRLFELRRLRRLLGCVAPDPDGPPGEDVAV